ncbi:MAG: Gfo/Idh/MocA family oxidoreductase [Thermoplasmata archaeon]|nr:Gfo/Idh/MocA family oxidoreductase [Thermoplasmata archaeon]
MVKFNVGIIGVGYWGKKIIYEYSETKNVAIMGVSDVSQDSLDYCKERYGVEQLTTDYNELLDNDDITAVNICTPNPTHYEICKTALEKGKHVLVEKPITLNSAEAKKLVELAEEKNLALSVGHIFRFNNALAEIRRLIEQKFFGKLYLLELRWVNLEPIFKDRDVLFDLAPHAFDILNYLTGEWPHEILCVGSAYRRKEPEETAYLKARYKNGIVAHANLSWLIPKKTRKVLIVGENRTAEIDAVGQEVVIYESGYTYKLGIERNNTIADELLHFIQSTGDPSTETKNSGFVGMKVIEMIEASFKSMREGKIVRLPQ